MILQVARFGAVGMAAFVVHWLSVVAIVPLGVRPLAANVIAFAIAFQVSYWGHRSWTFNAGHLSHRATLPRFLLTAGLGFVANELLYFLFETYTTVDYRISLFVILVVVTMISFFLGKRWAFR